MLKSLGCKDMDELLAQTLPAHIKRPLPIEVEALTENGAMEKLKAMLSANAEATSFLGQGYHGTKVPSPVLRHVLSNAAWYTAYTPYQAEISQGRMEALFNFQTGICELTGMEVANASMLDESTSAAEAVQMCMRLRRLKGQRGKVLLDLAVHPQTIDIIRERAKYLDLEIVVGDLTKMTVGDNVVCAMGQYPGTDGKVKDYTATAAALHAKKSYLIVGTDPLALTLMKPPSTMGADIVVGTAQRFGVPMWYGGPHAAFFATRKEFIRNMPGRIIGWSKDAQGNPGMRLTLQTREQHIRLDKATSNVCTAQALLASMSSMYMCYHGPEGLRQIAHAVKLCQQQATNSIQALGFPVTTGDQAFDQVTVNVAPMSAKWVQNFALDYGLAFRVLDHSHIAVSFDETHDEGAVQAVTSVLRDARAASEEVLTFPKPFSTALAPVPETGFMPTELAREQDFMKQGVYNSHHSETELMRYIKQLENKDLSLVHSMITLGSCTMKLNSVSSLLPAGWSEIAEQHPFMPSARVQGLRSLMNDLERHLVHVTGMDATSLQPCSGASGEYAGLCAIREYQAAMGEGHRDVCIIPKSAHGTNPASAAVANMRIVWVDDSNGMPLDELKALCEKYQDSLSAIMVTYPSTQGIFEQDIVQICDMIHAHGGQVYMDGANMNAQLGLTSPGSIGADVCHLNLHKTFSIPHGGGGPGLGPICCKSHLAPHLPGHRVLGLEGPQGAVQSGAPFGQAGIACIPWMFINMLGSKGLTACAEVAVLNANYMMARLKPYYTTKSLGKEGRCSHEFVLDLSSIRQATGISESDFAKRLMDYGFHAPTMSWPVPRSLMIEPTESEPQHELDRFCDALIQIHGEVKRVESGEWPKDNNPIVNAPHSMNVVCNDDWSRPYTREEAAFPLPWVKAKKFWPQNGRIDDVYGDKVLCVTWNDMHKLQQ